MNNNWSSNTLQPREQRKPTSCGSIRNHSTSKDCEGSYCGSNSCKRKSFSCRNRQKKEKNSTKAGWGSVLLHQFATVCALGSMACTKPALKREWLSAVNLDEPETKFSEAHLLLSKEQTDCCFMRVFLFFPFPSGSFWNLEQWTHLPCTPVGEVRGFWHAMPLVLRLPLN